MNGLEFGGQEDGWGFGCVDEFIWIDVWINGLHVWLSGRWVNGWPGEWVYVWLFFLCPDHAFGLNSKV